MPNFNMSPGRRGYTLSTQGVQRTSAGPAINPVLVDSRAGGSIRAMHINPSAGRTEYTPTQVPKAVHSNFFEEAANLAGVWANAALEFQQREDKVAADNAVIQYETFAREAIYGGVGKDGKARPGYAGTKGSEAISAFDATAASLDAERDKLLMELNPAARQMAVMRMHNTHGVAMTRASSHRVTELERARVHSLISEAQSIAGEFEVDPDRAMSLAIDHSKKFDDPVQAAKVLANMVTTGVKTIRDQAIQNKKTPAEAQALMRDFFNKHREKLPESIEVSVSSYVEQQSEILRNKQEVERNKELRKQQSIAEFKGASVVYSIFTAGPAAFGELASYRNHLYTNVFPDDPQRAKEVLSKNYKQALQSIALSEGYESAEVIWKNLQTRVSQGIPLATVDVMADVTAYMAGPLKNTVKTLQVDQIAEEKRDLFVRGMQATTPEELKALQDELTMSDMKAESMAFMNGFFMNRIASITKSRTDELISEQNLNYLRLRGDAERGNTPKFKYDIYKAVETQEISDTHAAKLLDRAEKFAEQKTKPGYYNLKTELKQLVDTEELYYDPDSRTVGFISMLSPDRKDQLKQRLKYLNKSPEVLKNLTIQAMMQEAEQWVNDPAHKDRTYSHWISEFYSQQPGVKENFLINLINRAVGILQMDYQKAFGPTPYIEEAPRVEYEFGQTPTGKEESYAPLSRTGKPPVPSVLAPSHAKIGGTVQEYAYTTVPSTYKTKYRDLNTDSLLALQMIRERRSSIDEHPIDSITSWVNQVMKTPEFEEWKTKKLQTLRLKESSPK